MAWAPAKKFRQPDLGGGDKPAGPSHLVVGGEEELRGPIERLRGLVDRPPQPVQHQLRRRVHVPQAERWRGSEGGGVGREGGVQARHIQYSGWPVRKNKKLW